jgi:cell fate regulator YaaT (PSP1 superfamily)
VKLQLKKAGIIDYDTHPFPKILRKASANDEARYKENLELEIPTMYKARSIAMELGLQMKLSDVEYRGDRRKATFFYTAEDRVDFRELIKRLADSFKVRIEMRQIGYRQEAGRLGAIGSCGRDLCCSTWLTDFKLVHTNAARYQNLSLNPLKLSGQCGKLKCCLNFELDSYLEAWKEFPDNDNLVLEFASGPYRQVKTDILKRMMWFAPMQEFGGEWLSLKVNEAKAYMEQNKEGIKPELIVQKKEAIKIDLDFQNDMGVDSLTRLDERKSSSKRNKARGRDTRNRNTNDRNREPRNITSEGVENTTSPRESKDVREQNDNRNRENRNRSNNNRNRQPREGTQPNNSRDGAEVRTPQPPREPREGDGQPRNNQNRNRNNRNNNRNRNNNNGGNNNTNNNPPA